ncbi:MAG: hypothetical protein IJ189_13750 [Clostridia bacterium]|nr:hypothetical protein [Clostridia bacterium]
MKKHVVLMVLCFLSLLLAGCGAQPGADAPAVTDGPSPAAGPEAPTVTAQGKLADAARALLSPYQDEIDIAAQKSAAVLTYLIPGDVMGKLAQDAQEVGAQPENGRYQFIWRQSGEHTYSASAMQIEQIEAAAETTPDPHSTNDPVMDNQQMGDFSATGGGLFDRSCAYDVDEHLRDGLIEITDTLNGAATGHEVFSFVVEEGCFFFVDGTLDQAVDMDGLIDTNRYLVAAGVLRQDGLEIVEFTVPSQDQVPTASADTWRQIQSQRTPRLSHLTVQGENVSAK